MLNKKTQAHLESITATMPSLSCSPIPQPSYHTHLITSINAQNALFGIPVGRHPPPIVVQKTFCIKHS
ncbi:hypothetical protein L596_011730 [Steinernema carpocapsae]|uniref:Uncharacterized protein n=1 Tax=Steinernema carpocapsae TaxID=34508 RepID=A0A4U5NVS5_STECR|nr:hypothetical protein L596_011730 [Steinernema carpocapsae]